jgi:hypothetical protein
MSQTKISERIGKEFLSDDYTVVYQVYLKFMKVFCKSKVKNIENVKLKKDKPET